MVSTATVGILLVEDNPGDARLLRESLQQMHFNHDLRHVTTMAQAEDTLLADHYDIILLDLSLPDSDAIGTVKRVAALAPDTPIVVLTGLETGGLDVEAVRTGAQDYLVKGRVTPDLLGRVMCYSMERKRTETQLRRARLQVEEMNDRLEQLAEGKTNELRMVVASLQKEVQQRKQWERQIGRANDLLRAVAASQQALLREADEETLLSDVCRIAVESGGYKAAWIGFALDDPDKTIRPAALYGAKGEALPKYRISWGANEWGNGPGGKAIRTGKPYVVQNSYTAPETEPWRLEMAKRGLASCAALPLKLPGRPLGVLVVFGAKPGVFDDAQIATLAELAEDVAWGIQTLRRQRALQQEALTLQGLLSQLPVAVWLIDSQGSVVMAQGELSPFGLAAHEVVGRPLEELGAPPEVVDAIRHTLAGSAWTCQVDTDSGEFQVCCAPTRGALADVAAAICLTVPARAKVTAGSR